MDNDRPFVNIGFDEAKKLYGDLIGEKRLLFYKIINLLVMNRHDADEIFQEAMLLGWENRHQLRTGPGFVAWMIKIIRSVAAKKRDLEQKDRRIWSVLFQAIQDSLPQRTHAHNPEGQMASEEEKTVAMSAYERLPDTERIIYGLYHAEDYTQAEIGQMLDMPQETVRNHLHRAQGRLEKRMHSMVLAVLLEQLHYDSSSELVQQVIDKIAASHVPAETVAVTAAAGAGIAEKTALGGFFTTLALPFLWIASLLISGTVSTTAFVRSMPTLQARRWLVKHLMVFYVGFVSIPISFVLIDYVIRSHGVGFESVNHLSVILFVSLVFCSLLWGWRLNRRYQQIRRNDTTVLKGPDEVEKFKSLIKKGLWITGGVIGLLLIFLLWEGPVINSYQRGMGYMREPDSIRLLVSIFIVGAFLLGFHFGCAKVFRYFTKIATDAAALPVRVEDNSEYPRSTVIREMIFVLPFLCFFIGSNILHLAIVRARIFSSILEILFYSIFWLLVLLQNKNYPELRWRNIISMFLFQFAIFQGLRYLFY